MLARHQSSGSSRIDRWTGIRNGTAFLCLVLPPKPFFRETLSPPPPATDSAAGPRSQTTLDDENPLAEVTRRLNEAASTTWVFTGDSITHGALYTEGWRSYPEHFAERVRWELRRFQDVVINTGVIGEGSARLLANLDARVLRFAPTWR